MLQFVEREIPVAKSMIELAQNASDSFQEYFCYWAAFNNIYTVIAKQRGIKARPVIDAEGNVERFQRWTYTFPNVKPAKERAQITAAIRQLDSETKRTLILHQNIPYFLDRKPSGVFEKHDSMGQEINGVLNVSLTVDPGLPVWSPINREAFESYISGDQVNQDVLVEQIVFLLYTVRNNLVHGSKNPIEENDLVVVEKALPILRLLVVAFMR